jgi:hypothetical protein
MHRVVAALTLVLFVLHHDAWNWGDRAVVLGFLPVGLAYHVAYSVAAAALWAFAVKFAWPEGLERWADGGAAAPGGDDRLGA